MIVRETTDIEEIKSVLCHKDIFSYISEGVDIEPEEYEPPLNNVVYLIGYSKGRAFALACFHPFKDGLKFHPNVLSGYRLKYARDFVKQSLCMIKCPVYVEIPKNRKRLQSKLKKKKKFVIDVFYGTEEEAKKRFEELK